METILRDLRQAVRGFLRSPGFALTAILILAIGIGANTAVFSLVHAILVRPLPYRDPGRLVWVWSTRTDRDKAFFSIPNFIDTRAEASSLEAMAAIANWSANLTGAGDPERVTGIRVTPELFPMLGVEPEVGHLLPVDGGVAANPRFVLLSHRLWQRRFGGDPGVLGRALPLSGDLYVVSGVLPPGFIVPGSETDGVVPLDLAADPRREERGSNFLRVVARLRDRATPEASAGELAAITTRLVERYPDPNAKLTAPRVVPLADEIVGGVRPGLTLLLLAVGLVLLVACANLAGLLLARAAARRREMGVRMALGARRLDLARSQFVESGLLAILGGAVGLGTAWWSLDLLVGWSPSALPRAGEVSLDPVVLGFTLAIALLSGLLFGTVPAILGSRSGPLEAMRGDGSGVAPGRTRAVLVVSQAALSLVLLVSVGLLTRSLAGLQAIDPGFAPENLLTVRLSLPAARYATPASVRGFYDRLAPDITRIPGVVAVGAVSVLPLSGMNARSDFSIVGHDAASARERPAAQNRWASPGYIETMRIEVRRGRSLTEHDDADALPVALVDETLARRFWPGTDPLGAQIRIDDAGGAPSRKVAIVGIVAAVRHFTLDEEPLGTIYTPFYQVPPGALSFLANNLTLVVRGGRDPL
ncbi:MAG TPA: ADOP family duplicated permease, partial [Candidatus Polarisedimenticolia bacterium]|nr:ADOP family duplicated permease [Candidatus Polarisedimenticolia bacterium]